MKRGFLGPSRNEPAGLCTIRKSTRDVSIDTLQAATIDSVSQASNDTIHHVSENTIHRSTIHPGIVHHVTVHPGTVHHNTIHPGTVHPDTIHHNTIHSVSENTVHPELIDTIHPTSIDTVHRGIVHRGTVHLGTVHPVSIDTIHVPSIDTVHPASVDTIHLPSIDTVHPNTVHRNTIHRGTVPPMTNTTYGETEKVEALILKIDKKGIWRDEEGRLCSLTGQLINAEGSVIPDVIAVAETNTFNLTSLCEENGDIGTPTTHVKQPYIQVHHADESKQKDELNREKLVNHDIVKDDEYHVSGEQSKVEADTKDPTSASIDSSNSESIDIRTSETIDTNICHRSIPSTRTGRPKAIRDYNSPEDAYAK
ncbi:unnamed protein product, partial [Brassica rapa]